MPVTNKVYKDLNITFNKHPVTGKLSVLKDEDAVKRAVRNLILTDKFERRYQPLIGASVRRKLFEPLDSISIHSLKKDIRVALSNYEPRVTVHDIIVRPNEDQNQVDISVVFRIDNQANPVAVDVTLERVR